MPTPERSCNTCKHWRPYTGSKLLEETFGKCASPRKSATVEFAETCRGIPDLCGPTASWWERKPAVFEIVEDGPQELDWEDDAEDDA